MDVPSLQTAIPWHDVLVGAGVCARMTAAVCTGTLPILEGVSFRIRAALSLALAVVAAPLAWRGAAIDPGASPALLLAGEAVVGLAAGTAMAAVLMATGWAGGILGSVSGLSWADDFSPAGDSQAAGVARLAWWIGLAAFLAAGGQLTVVGGLVDSVLQIPVGSLGSATGRESLLRLAVAMPTVAISLAVSLAIPALAAVLAFHLAAVFCLRTANFSPAPGFLQSLAALVLLGGLWLGLDTWMHGGPAMMLGSIADFFTHR